MLCFRLLIYFLSYTRSLKCGQLQDWKTCVGVYVKCYCFSIFVVVDSVYYKYQYSKTYTLCCGLNRLQVYVTEIKEKQIFVFLLFLSHTPEVYSNHNTVCMFYCIGIYNKHCLPLQKLKNNNI